MVRFEIEDYCQNCKELDPVVLYSVEMYSGLNDERCRETLVKCKKHEICAAMWADMKKRYERKAL